jgi:hypothetical protein
MPFYLSVKEDSLDRLPECVCFLAEALYDAESVVADPSVYSDEERERLFEQVRSNLEHAFAIAGGSEDELTGLMVQISQVVARQFKQNPS